MTELLHAALRFPTVVFTIALGIALVYWVFVLVGALDLDLLGGGHVDGIGDGIGDVGGHDVGHDGGGDGGHDGDGGGGGGVWQGLGLGAVPLTISITVILLVGWSSSLLAMTYLVGDSGLLRALLLPFVLVLSLPVAALLVRPLAPMFRVHEGKSNADYVGHVCTVTSNSVDDAFGFATIEDGGSLVQISVRCDKAGTLLRGDKALVIEFDAARRNFVVEPAVDMLPPAEAGEEKSNG
ncbi:MAG: hypothetical protein NT062_21880 [Proteobacteria bacterium]|nr:hypothetical protein [Pseudomonadota bacterium]